ncbi:hypothetical protein ACXC9Q_04165 [Kribbella sp. CWNU-51]
MTDRSGPRQLFEDWIRAMTIFGEPGHDPEHLEQKVAMIAAVNQPGAVGIKHPSKDDSSITSYIGSSMAAILIALRGCVAGT